MIDRKPRRLRHCLIDTCGSRSDVEDLDDTAPLRTAIGARDPADVVSRDTPLLVRGTRQRDERLFAGHQVLHLHRIAHRVNIGCGCFHMVVH